VAPVGDSLVGDVGAALEQLLDLVEVPADRQAPPGLQRPTGTELPMATAPLLPNDVYAVLSTVKPDDAAVVMESTSTLADLIQWWPTRRTGSFFATGSGGIGWGVPAAVGIALGDRARGVKRTIVASIGDGSFQYSIQAIWTAAQHKLPIVFVVQRNGEYCVLKSFALLEETPNVPGLNLPGLDIAALATGFGCRTATVDSTEELARQFKAALEADGPTVLVVPTQPQLPFLG
jgi:benzoylformate decarboxylase